MEDDIDMVIESLLECAEVLNEYRYKLLLKQRQRESVHIEPTDNECLGDMQFKIRNQKPLVFWLYRVIAL